MVSKQQKFGVALIVAIFLFGCTRIGQPNDQDTSLKPSERRDAILVLEDVRQKSLIYGDVEEKAFTCFFEDETSVARLSRIKNPKDLAFLAMALNGMMRYGSHESSQDITLSVLFRCIRTLGNSSDPDALPIIERLQTDLNPEGGVSLMLKEAVENSAGPPALGVKALIITGQDWPLVISTEMAVKGAGDNLIIKSQ